MLWETNTTMNSGTLLFVASLRTVIVVSYDEVKLSENADFEDAYVEKSLKENADFTHAKEIKRNKQGRKTMLVKVL